MEQSSLQPPNSDPDQKSKISSGKNGDPETIDPKDSGNPRVIADRLLAALASGNLDHLAQAREAFLKQAPTARKRETFAETSRPAKETRITQDFSVEIPPALETLLERRAKPRTPQHPFA